jgi:hypothetical protein
MLDKNHETVGRTQRTDRAGRRAEERAERGASDKEHYVRTQQQRNAAFLISESRIENLCYTYTVIADTRQQGQCNKQLIVVHVGSGSPTSDTKIKNT